jgi:hypothetical protein
MPDQDKSDPPGAVSDQNQEEQPSGMRDDREHPEPRSREDEDEKPARDGDRGGSSGAAGEGSQSTGHPDSAG